MNLVERVKGILLQPKSEWAAIEREPGNAGYLFPNYVAIVAAIPPVCAFIGTSIIGVGPFRIGIVCGLLQRHRRLCAVPDRRLCSWPTSSIFSPAHSAREKISTMR